MTVLHKKLIEVALPLEAINKASAREKSIRHGHPSTLHLWWARRPLAAARAVIFAQMVDDPSSHPETFPTPEAQDKERQRLFRLIEQLVLWDNTTKQDVLNQVRDEIWKSWRVTCAAACATICKPSRPRAQVAKHPLPSALIFAGMDSSGLGTPVVPFWDPRREQHGRHRLPAVHL